MQPKLMYLWLYIDVVLRVVKHFVDLSGGLLSQEILFWLEIIKRETVAYGKVRGSCSMLS